MFDIDKKFFLAPLAGYSDELFRHLVKLYGADITVTEMVSVKGLIYKQKKTFELLATQNNDHPVGVQLFGYEVDDFVHATDIILEQFCVDFVDINVGCPVKKVIKQKAGSYLLKEPKQIGAIVKSLVERFEIPITVKIRTGWDNHSKNYIDISKIIEDNGASFLTVHGRTRTELFSGEIDYKAIREIKESISIPVVGSGDIADLPSLNKMKETKCDAFMIGRAAIGQPWIFEELKSGRVMSLEEKFQILMQHFELYIQKFGDELGMRKFRAFGVHYLKKMFHRKILLQQLFEIKNKKEMYKFFAILKAQYVDLKTNH